MVKHRPFWHLDLFDYPESGATFTRTLPNAQATAEGQFSRDARKLSSNFATCRRQRRSTAHAVGMRLHAAATPQIPSLAARRRQAGVAAGPRSLRRQAHDLSRERLQKDRLIRSWQRRDPGWQHCRLCMWHIIQYQWATEHPPCGGCRGSEKMRESHRLNLWSLLSSYLVDKCA